MNKIFWNKILDSRKRIFFIYEAFLLLGGSILSIYPIQFMEKVINAAVYRETNAIKKITFWGSIYLLLQIFRAFIVAFSDFLAKQKQAEITFTLQLYTFSHITRVKLSQIKFNDTSNISATLVEDTQYAGENIITSYTQLITSIFNFVLGMYYISKINPWLCVLIFPLGLISSIMIKKLSEESFDNLAEQRKQLTELWKTFEEGILGFLPLRLHHDIENYFEKIKIKGFALKQTLQKQARLESTSYFYTSSLFMVTIGCIMIVSSVFVVKNKITIGNLTAIMMYNNLLSEPLIKIQDIIKKIQKLNVSMSRLMDIYSMESEQLNNQMGRIDEILIQNVSYEINENIILENINLDIKKGNSIMIKGKTGVGKTTLVNIITGVYSCSSGKIIYLYKKNQVEYTPKISYMLQDEYLFDDTIYNNILIGNRNACSEDVKKVISICNLKDVMREHSGRIGSNGKKLSGGERKRILLARTILDSTSDIYVFDEFSSSLDQKSYIELWERIDNYLNDKIRIYIEHNTVLQQKMDCTINIKEKSIFYD